MLVGNLVVDPCRNPKAEVRSPKNTIKSAIRFGFRPSDFGFPAEKKPAFHCERRALIKSVLRSGLGHFGGLGLLCGNRLFGFGQGRIDPFKDRAFARIALALAQFDYAGVASVTLLLGRSDFGKEDFDGIFLVQPGGGKPAVVQSAALAQRNHLFGDRAGSLGFG